jgi:hypothetical protein
MVVNLWLDATAAVGLLHVVGPMALRHTFRFASTCRPTEVPFSGLPLLAADEIGPRIRQLKNLGFELQGCYDCGELSTGTKNFVAYFVNHRNHDVASISVVLAPFSGIQYMEFSTRLAGSKSIDTNTNSVLPLSPQNPDTRVFRFPDLTDPAALYEVHRRLAEKYSDGLPVEGEGEHQAIERMVHVVENYGARHAKLGYMYFSADGQYRLTWKGAVLMSWRALWPLGLLRRILHRHAMNSELRSLQLRGETRLQKA